MRVAGVTADPETALGVELHLEWVDEFWVVFTGGEAVDAEAFC